MPDTKLVIFGSPKAGTPLRLATPSIAIAKVGPNSNTEFLDHISYLHGKHAFKFGGEFNRQRPR